MQINLVNHFTTSFFALSIDGDFENESLCLDKLFQRNKIVRTECGFKETGWITLKHL